MLSCRRRLRCLLLPLVLLAGAGPALGVSCPADNPEGRERVHVGTVLGDICLEMLGEPGEAPLHVANFLAYVGRGDYDGTFLHRSVPGFVLQGGGFRFTPGPGFEAVPQDPPVTNEPGIPNTRGTVAMAKLAGDPNSAKNQWFINLADNTALDTQNGGFTVFARVVGGMDVVDQLEALHREWGWGATFSPFGPAFTNLPVLTLLDRDPFGYGCDLIVEPDPPMSGQPVFTHSCSTQMELDAAVDLMRADLEPQLPERLVVVEEVVALPEPAAALLGLVGATVLAAAARPRA